MRFNTPLRYPGGKGKLFNFMDKIIGMNKLQDLHYAEPYAGGAGLALKLLFKESASQIYLNDLNLAVYSFWDSVLNRTDELCHMILRTDVTMDEWHFQKSIITNPENQDLLQLAFATFFLNRTNRSGILKGGVIGGKNQSGKWKLDARYNKEDLIRRIKLIAEKKNQIHVFNLDANDFITKVIMALPENSLTYFDPPYYVKGKGLYENHYVHEDHVLISTRIQSEIKTPWIVSYDNVLPIRTMYSSAKTLSYGINYSAQERYTGDEVMYFSNGLKYPECADPAKFKV
ncbi:DNA adenine methylase [Klebsiella pneumoniae]|uniref:DNA adenine methylase n=1 Tax=Klebsiella pneumoniae TaxID=573 RepID=UPI0012615155|nr:DNA adenine methylase [Klebsiella pneumoniae]ELT6818338.1 DNA adenine methylase [Klebsiella pneumoniae]KAB7520550.1 DNA adenine methylase [Klebsiella pneumoniae]MBZ6932105.1 DNA adenine methylase [Klebsiella pneumoniae]MCJ7019928.1 DNA adenine methylase [Klebsiella pneumoniae]GKI82908.1 DNA methyltransferase [Klebsiella pneumoniae]